MSMNKTELIAHVADAAGLNKAEASRAVEAVLAGITETLAEGGNVVLTGFGSFSVSQRAARTGRNPKTGEHVDVPASNAPKFKAGATLKAAVN